MRRSDIAAAATLGIAGMAWAALRSCRVLRVVTFPLRTSTDKATLLSAVDGDVAAVMLGRLAVLEARSEGSGEQAIQYL